MIAAASVLLCAFCADASQAQAHALLRDHAAGRERLKAPTLVVYEVTNAVWQAERRGRISGAQADKILQAASGREPPAGAQVQSQRLRCGVPQPGRSLERTHDYGRQTTV